MPFLPSPADAHGLTAIGYCDLGDKSAFKLAMHRHGDRWLLYTGTFWEAGFNIIDVTDPADPRFLRHVAVDVPAGSLTLQIQIADGVMITSVETVTSVTTGDATQPQSVPSPSEGFSIWSLEDPGNPARLGHFSTGGEGTPRNFYAGGRYVYATALPLGLSGTHPADRGHQRSRGACRGRSLVASGPMARRWRGRCRTWHPAARRQLCLAGSRVPPYGAGGLVVLDISDVRTPRMISALSFSPPFNSYIAVHTAIPLEDRPLVLVNSEAVAENGDEPLNFAGIVDISDETAPRLVSLCPLPATSQDAPFRNYYEKGGRFGPHNQHQWQGNDALLHDENLLFLTYFNAGLRVYDISDERAPREVGWFVPPDPQTRLGPLPSGALVTQTEDVLVDARGNIYITDKNQGIYVLRQDA